MLVEDVKSKTETLCFSTTEIKGLLILEGEIVFFESFDSNSLILSNILPNENIP